MDGMRLGVFRGTRINDSVHFESGPRGLAGFETDGSYGVNGMKNSVGFWLSPVAAPYGAEAGDEQR